MANHLRDLIECLENGRRLASYGDLSAEKVEALKKLMLMRARRAISFDAGEANDYCDLTIIDELVRLPYECCWIEMHRQLDDGPVVFGMMATEDGGRIEAQVWIRRSPLWIYEFTFFVEHATQKCKAFHVQPDLAGVANHIVSLFRAFLSAMNCTNVRRVEHKPDAKLQKARAKRGKQPLFSYWTLELDLTRAESSESQGGTHALPRLHLRRGHPRQYAPGKWTWVQPCAVGNKKAGMVHKDYAVRAPQ